MHSKLLENNRNSMMTLELITLSAVNSSRQLTPDEVVDTGDADLLDQKSRKTFGTHCDVNVEEDNDKHNSNDESLDSFILKKFVRFSGDQNVIQWLDDVENKLKSFYIDRQIRFETIPLLIEGAAPQQYIRNRKNIPSFDDFYEFLLLQFECLDNVERANNNQLGKNTSVNDRTTVNQKTVLNNSNESIVNESNKNSRINQTLEISSETTVNLGTTNTIADVPVNKTIVISNELFTSLIDETNPKIFKGRKDNAQQWIQELEYLFQITHIQDATKLDFFSYSLRADALAWFRNHKSSLTSWKALVLELKKAFPSSVHIAADTNTSCITHLHLINVTLNPHI
ncbi:unnamed protein product [Rotaria socialis]|uniref:Retrotransposon gag domain-containing protein n=1 Tax=Rotaria socialis TaxID=392032 RepID=A0A821SZJ2_9BILA|nr:unnamed protein product [Rotaria socialis]